MDILEIVKKHRENCSLQELKIANYVLTQYDKVVFMTASKLAETVGVSQPTVIRFAQHLGFVGYHEFVGALQELIRLELTTPDRFSISLRNGGEVSRYPIRFINKEIETLTLFSQHFPFESYKKALQIIATSHKVYVIGMRGSAALVMYFSYFLSKVKRPVFHITHGGTINYDLLLEMEKKDLAIIVTFPRYPEETIRMARYLRKKGHQILTITDNSESPVIPFSDLSIIVPVSFSTIFDSYLAPFCLFNMIVTDVGKTSRQKAQKLINDFEVLAEEVNIFHKVSRRQRDSRDE